MFNRGDMYRPGPRPPLFVSGYGAPGLRLNLMSGHHPLAAARCRVPAPPDPSATKTNPRPPLNDKPSAQLHATASDHVNFSESCVTTQQPSQQTVGSQDEEARNSSLANNTNNNNNIVDKSSGLSDNALLIRDILTCKLAAVSEMMEHSVGVLQGGHYRHPAPTLPAINNNHGAAASIMNHLLKVRQEMALNMSKDSDSDRHTDASHGSDNEQESEPINLQNNGRSSSVIGSGSDGESPLSPDSDAGNSTGSNKDLKASRLENIVGGLARSTSSPLPPQGCNKRKLYRPIQHEEEKEDEEEGEEEEPDMKRKKEGLENQLKCMQDQLVRMQSRFSGNEDSRFMSGNDENTDPEKDGELQIDLERAEKKYNSHIDEITIEKKLNPKSFSGFGHPLLNGSAEPLPLPPTPLNPNYMDLAKRFLQEQQDKITKEMITRDIVHSTIGRNDIADKLAAISPELEGLADILKSEITTSLTIIVDSIVQRFLTAKRQPLAKFEDGQENKPRTPSGRAPQVRDRATPRTVANPLSMASPQNFSNALNSGLGMVSKPSFALGDRPLMTNIYNSHLAGQHSDDDRENDEMEQDDALNLVVTPKKKRHKVTDTRITPRTVSRLLGGDYPASGPISSIADLHKHFNPSPQHQFMPHGFPLPKHLVDLPRPPFPGLPPSLLHSLPSHDFPFPPFGFPGAHHLNRPRDLSPPMERARSASPPRDSRPPPPLLHPGMMAGHSPDMREERPVSRTSSDDMRFDTPGGHTPFSLASMSGKHFGNTLHKQ